MKFLAVLVIVFLYRHWIGENPLRRAIPFGDYVHWFKQRMDVTNLTYLLCVGIPVLVAFLVAGEVRYWLLGLVWLALALAILLYSIDIIDTEVVFDDQNDWLSGLDNDASVEDVRQRQEDFKLVTLYEAFQSLFPALFWFLLLGPAGALLYVLTRQYLDELDHSDPEIGFVDQVVYWLEWPAARITGILFAFVGHFGRCFDAWLDSLVDTREEISTTLVRTATAAVVIPHADEDNVHDLVKRSEIENRELRTLLDYTVFGWLGLAAIAVIIGF